MSLRRHLESPCSSSVSDSPTLVPSDASSSVFAAVRLLPARPESPSERQRKSRVRRAPQHQTPPSASSSNGWSKRWWLALTVAFFLTTMPCAHGLLAANMSAMAERVVKEHMRNSQFTGEDPRKQTRFWQLYNHCSHGYVQIYYRAVNARGMPGSKCLIDFKVVSDTFGGRVRLQHALSGRYLCFNRRRRVTVRQDGSSPRCEFVEHLTDAGYTELESAWTPGLFLGFNRKGRFQDPLHFPHRRRCFAYTKFDRIIPDVASSRLAQCSGIGRSPITTTTTTTTPEPALMPSVPPVDQQRLTWNAMRSAFLNKVRATAAPPVSSTATTTTTTMLMTIPTSSTSTPPPPPPPSPVPVTHPHRHHRRHRYWR